MIRYQLRCERGHAFEDWFDSIADFDRRAENGALRCPTCGDTRVDKAIMAPSLGAAPREAPVPACAGNGGAFPCGMCGAGGE